MVLSDLAVLFWGPKREQGIKKMVGVQSISKAIYRPSWETAEYEAIDAVFKTRSL
jgi:hypothetical protein